MALACTALRRCHAPRKLAPSRTPPAPTTSKTGLPPLDGFNSFTVRREVFSELREGRMVDERELDDALAKPS